MINCRWIGAFINTSVVFGLIFLLSGCAAQQTKTADVEQRVATEQRAGEPAQEVKPSVSAEKQAIGRKDGAIAKESGKNETVMCLCEQYTVKKRRFSLVDSEV